MRPFDPTKPYYSLEALFKQKVAEHYAGWQSLEDAYRHLKRVSDITGMRSGFFRIPFSILVPYLEREIKKNTISR